MVRALSPLMLLALTSSWVGAQFAAPIPVEKQLQRVIRLDGKKRTVQDWVKVLEGGLDVGLAVSSYIPPTQVSLASPGSKGEVALESLARVLEDSRYRYAWRRYQTPDGFGLLLTRSARTGNERINDTVRNLDEALRRWGNFDPEKGNIRSANNAVPARYALLASLPPHIRSQAVRQALVHGRAVLPLTAFNRRTLIAACGGVEVSRNHPTTGQREVMFSSKSIERGSGYVALFRQTSVEGPPELVLSIGSGPVPRDLRQRSGPASPLLHDNDLKNLSNRIRRSGAKPDAALEGKATEIAETVTLRASRELKAGEVTLLALLRQLAEKSGRVVACRFPKQVKVEGRLASDLVQLPVREAADRVAAPFDLKARVEKALIWFVPGSASR